jgi:hypothetical protein
MFAIVVAHAAEEGALGRGSLLCYDHHTQLTMRIERYRRS